MTKEILFTEFEKLEAKREQLIMRMKNTNYEKLNALPAKDKWSIAQICHHLILSEKLSLLYIRKKLHYKTNIQNTHINSSVRLRLLKIAFSLPISFKAPENVAKLPEQSNMQEISTQWEKVRADMKKLIEVLPQEFLTGNIFKHPMVGKMNIHDTLDFFSFHFNHHRKQIERLL